MGQARLVARLAARDLRRRRTEAALLLVAIVAATTTLTLGLTVRGLVSDPYQSTREATAGPDVVATIGPPPGDTPGQQSGQPTDIAALEDLTKADRVVSHSGPYPVAGAEMEAKGQTMDVQVIGRDTTPASLDRPEVTQGGWVHQGGVVIEAAFADAKDVNVGDQVTLNSQPFEVAGIAVTAASSPYPKATCYSACAFDATSDELSEIPTWVLREPGLVWVTRSDALELASEPDSLPHVLYLQLEDPDEAREFVNTHGPRDEFGVPGLLVWQDILEESSYLVRDAQRVFLIGSGLLSLMAMATVAVLVVGRLADQSRRVGLLKAVGGTPRLVAAVLLAEYVAVALLAALVGLTLGWLAAPLLTEPSVGLLGAAAPSLSLYTIAVVTGVALVVAVIATFVPAVRASRSSTVVALADTAHAPRRTTWLIAISSRLPTPLLLALRTLGRRPRRVVFSILGIAVTVSGPVAAVAGFAQLDEQLAAGGSRAESVERLWPVLMVIMATLVALAAVNAVVITWATVLDTRHASAVERALGATPQQVSAGLAMAQILPALAGAILGVPGGIGLLFATDDVVPSLPPFWQFAAVVLVAVVLIALLTAIPARSGGRRPVVEILQSEHG
jgi:ABC-type lipoprotein release transport system permease subunit